MEGLIPMVYNVVKKKKKMKYYSNLSSGSKLYTDTEPDACASTTDRFFMSPQPEDYKSRSASAQYQDRFFYTPQREHLGTYTNHGTKKHFHRNLPPLPQKPTEKGSQWMK
jgi:hypothetical protein